MTLDLPVARSFPRQAALALSALFLLILGVYLVSLSPAFHPDDSAETITAGATLSIQHPPGYPLHSLLGRLAVLAGPGPAAFNINSLAAFCASLAIVLAACLLYALGREFAPWESGRTSLGLFALGGAAALACTQTLWFQATIAKGGIYTLNLALSLATLLALLKVRDAGLLCPVEQLRGQGAYAGGGFGCGCPDPRALRLAGLCFGLALANHWTSQVVLLPGYALLLAEPRWRRQGWPSPLSLLRIAVWPALFALMGVALYAYLAVRTRLGAPLVWGDAGTWKGLLWIFTRSQYAGVESNKTLASFLALLQRIGADVVQDWTWPGVLLLAGGWALLLRRRFLLALGLLALPLSLAVAVAWKANPPADSFFIIDPYLIPVHVGLGLGLAGWMAIPRLRRWLGPGLFLGAVGLGLWQWQDCEHRQDYLGYDYAQNLYLSTPHGALLFCEGDSNTATPMFKRFVQGGRKDLALVAAVLIDYPWYQRSLLGQDPSLKLPPQPLGPGGDMAWMALANAPRPVVWTNSYTKGWVNERQLLPHGLVLLRSEKLSAPWSAAQLQANHLWPAYALRGVFEPQARRMDAISVRLVRDNYIEAAARLAEAYLAVKAWPQAREEFRRLGVLRGGWAPPWLQAGNAAYFQGDKSAAKAFWTRARDEDGHSAEAWANLGLIAFEQQRYADALQFAREALQFNPALPNAKELESKALPLSLGLGMAPKAPPVVGDRGAVAATRGDELAKAGKHAAALEAYELALKQGYENWAVHRNRAVMLGSLGRNAEAAAAIEQALRLDAKQPELFKLHGYYLFNSGHQQQGVAELAKAVQMAPTDADLKRLYDDARKKAGL